MNRTLMKSARVLWVGTLFGLLLAAVFYLWQLNGSPTLGIDDASIFLGYARNIAEGRGITYAGNHTPVEGCTSMAWLLLCSVSYLLGMGPGCVWILQLALFFCTVLVWDAVLHKLVTSPKRRLLSFTFFVALLASSPGYITWMAVTLMDVTLWGLVVSGLAYFAVVNVQDEGMQVTSRQTVLLTGLFLLAPWVRPETLMVVPLIFVFLFVIRVVRHYALRVLWLPLLAFCVSLVTLTVFRLVYFGYPFPNTYYAKVSPSLLQNISSGYWYLVSYIMHEPRVWLCVVSTLAGVQYCVWNRSKIRTGIRFFPLLALLLLLLIIPVLTGGDHFKQHRFYQPAFPLACVCLVAMLHDVACHVESRCACMRDKRIGFKILCGCPTVLLLLAFAALPCEWRYWIRDGSPLTYEFFLAEKGYETGAAMNEWFSGMPVKPRIGVITAGGISLSYPWEIVDLMGLNNVAIAHHRGCRSGYKNHAAFEPSLFDSFKVDLIIVEPMNIGFVGRVLKGLCSDPNFTSHWSYGVMSRPDSDKQFRVLIENGFLARARTETGITFGLL